MKLAQPQIPLKKRIVPARAWWKEGLLKKLHKTTLQMLFYCCLIHATFLLFWH